MKPTREVFDLMRSLVAHALAPDRQPTTSRIELLNASKRHVVVRFSSDPDICIQELISSQTVSKLVAIEIKGGQDKSNIWNRLGEAEKSHQSAKAQGYRECWTIYNVPDLDSKKAREKSPSTTRFYHLKDLLSRGTRDWQDFSDRLFGLVGIPSPPE